MIEQTDVTRYTLMAAGDPPVEKTPLAGEQRLQGRGQEMGAVPPSILQEKSVRATFQHEAQFTRHSCCPAQSSDRVLLVGTGYSIAAKMS